MTYVTDQTSAELREHMLRLTARFGWHDPLADRLWREVQALDAENARLRAALAAAKEAARINASAGNIFDAMWSDAETEAADLREAVLWLIPLARVAARPEDAERFAQIRALVGDEPTARGDEGRDGGKPLPSYRDVQGILRE